MHTVAALYSASHDFPRREEGPSNTFMLATIPRSGSTYFAIRLWQTGALGAPMEYLNFPILGRLLKRLRVDLPMDARSVLKYWKAVKALRTSPNGVFGYKMFMNNYVN